MTARSVRVRGRDDAGTWIEAARGGRIRLVVAGAPVLWARMEPAYAGVWTLRRAGSVSLEIVPPIRSTEARRARDLAGWAHAFERMLAASPRTPARGAGWQLTEMQRVRPSIADRARGVEHDAFGSTEPDGLPASALGVLAAIDRGRLARDRWLGHAPGRVLLLRDPSEPGAPRVRSWRKHARDGSLPPILLWWITALDTFVLLDGHDRLVAAREEGVSPGVRALWQEAIRSVELDERVQREIVARYELAHVRGATLSAETRARLNRGLVGAFEQRWRIVVSHARARPQLATTSRREVIAELGDRAAEMLGEGPVL